MPPTFGNPTAAVNLILIGKQYLTLLPAEAAGTRNLIGMKIISNVKRSDTRNSVPKVTFVEATRLDEKHFKRHTLKSETPRCVRVLQINATSNDSASHTCLESHLTFPWNIETRQQWSVGDIE